jgi:hypothetical protein
MLYNLKSIKGKYLIAKFSLGPILELEGSYVISGNDCTCPAGSHGKYCRHKEMKHIFIKQGKVNTPYFYDYDTGKWYLFESLEQEM